MEMAALLGVIRAQRHDFLNHLQVISGFIQLNKYERAREYIREVARELERQGRIIHLQMPEATFALLVALKEAALAQVKVQWDIQCQLVSCAVPGTRVGRALEAVLLRAVEVLSSPEVTRRFLAISLKEQENCYVFRLLMPHAGQEAMEEAVAVAREELADYGGEAELTVQSFEEEPLAEVTLSLPCRGGN